MPLLIEQLCKENLEWDETIPDNIQGQWKKRERQLKKLEGLSVDRCFKLANFGKIVDRNLHHFEDACEYVYEQASYLRIVDESGRIHYCLVIEQWHYMNTNENPADYFSRRISIGNRDKIERWILGPKFLWEPEDT